MTAPLRNQPGLSAELADELRRSGQGHLIEALKNLPPAGQQQLTSQIVSVDWETVGELREQIDAPPPVESRHEFEPPDVFPIDRTPAQHAQAAAAVAEGHRLLAAGNVAALVVAGGQASRLGLDGPKGTVPAGPVSRWSLFELFARKLRAVEERSGQPVPFYVMTSPTNDAATQAFFADHDYFGLDLEHVVFFIQGVLPALDESGNALLAEADSLALAPTGHGGVFSALRNSGAMGDLRTRGIELISYFQVDNPLVHPADPLFLGMHSLQGAGMSSKVVRRQSADEKVGVIARIDGQHGCVEYSNLPDELRGACNDDGSLRFSAGNIAMHVISVEFAASRVGSSRDLPWTLAHKRMRVAGPDGQPTRQMAYKAEQFVFDALRLSPKTVTLEVDRAVEFSPIKNAKGANSPATSKAAICALHSAWAAASGQPLPPPVADGATLVEVDPRFALTKAEFAARMPARPQSVGNGHLYTVND